MFSDAFKIGNWQSYQSIWRSCLMSHPHGFYGLQILDAMLWTFKLSLLVLQNPSNPCQVGRWIGLLLISINQRAITFSLEMLQWLRLVFEVQFTDLPEAFRKSYTVTVKSGYWIVEAFLKWFRYYLKQAIKSSSLSSSNMSWRALKTFFYSIIMLLNYKKIYSRICGNIHGWYSD